MGNDTHMYTSIESLMFDDNRESYKCHICGGLMKDPVQTFRGYGACYLCYKNSERNDGLCPIDNEPISSNQVFRDKAKAKEILNLECFCENRERGCEWNGTVREFEKHVCNYILKQCEFCEIPYEKEKVLQHFKECTGIYKSGDCILQSVGCTFKADTKEEMKKHIQEDAALHLIYQTKYHENIHSMNDELQKNFQQHNEQQKKCEKTLNEEMHQLKKTIEVSNKHLDNFQEQTRASISKLTQALEDAMKKWDEQTAQLLSGGAMHNVEDKKEAGVPTKQLLNIVKKNSNNISELDLRFQLHENTTHDGRIVWKIDNYKRRCQEAMTGKITALHSAPCFTSQYGYKFCARLYMNGDGMGRGTHISLFTVLMKSEYDNLLDWPFAKQVNFTLINQVDQQKNIVQKLVPGKDSSSFKKPVKEMNVASGCPLFAPLDKLESEGFVKDDCLFIEVKVNP